MTQVKKTELMHELVTSIKLFQDSVDRFDSAAADYLSVNNTDLRCLTALYDLGPLLASQVAQVLGLTKGAITAALNRLEEAGYAKRHVNSNDGRSFRIELTAVGKAEITAIWSPIRINGRELMDQFSPAELRVLNRFFMHSIELHNLYFNELKSEATVLGGRAGVVN